MSKNVIFYFSGTGNSLVVAKETAKFLRDCEIVSMSSNKIYSFTGDYDRIGFVYPTYFLGIPLKVREYVSKLELPGNKDVYYFAIATLGAIAGNALPKLNDILASRNASLNFGAELVMFSNYVVLYDMANDVDKINKISHEKLIPIIDDIKNKRAKKIKKTNPVIDLYYNFRAKRIPAMDKDFSVSDQCTSCGICKEVCAAGNIRMVDNKPRFEHHCEQCVACIQFCPKRAINYKNRTQKRRRYTNPNISYKELGTE